MVPFQKAYYNIHTFLVLLYSLPIRYYGPFWYKDATHAVTAFVPFFLCSLFTYVNHMQDCGQKAFDESHIFI